MYKDTFCPEKKLPENLRICKNCSSNQVENEVHFLLHRDSYSCIRKTLLNDILSKYFIFNTLNEQDKILFLFNNVDHYICEKTGYFGLESFKKRKRESRYCN